MAARYSKSEGRKRVHVDAAARARAYRVQYVSPAMREALIDLQGRNWFGVRKNTIDALKRRDLVVEGEPCGFSSPYSLTELGKEVLLLRGNIPVD